MVDKGSYLCRSFLLFEGDKMGLFDKFKKKDHVGFLKKNINKAMSLSEIVDVFEKMCAEPIDNDMLLFETGTYHFLGEPNFYFCLVRQFPNKKEEFYQIHVDVLYKPNSGNKEFSDSVWNDNVEGNFFDYIRHSRAFENASSDKIEKIEIYMDET